MTATSDKICKALHSNMAKGILVEVPHPKQLYQAVLINLVILWCISP